MPLSQVVVSRNQGRDYPHIHLEINKGDAAGQSHFTLYYDSMNVYISDCHKYGWVFEPRQYPGVHNIFWNIQVNIVIFRGGTRLSNAITSWKRGNFPNILKQPPPPPQSLNMVVIIVFCSYSCLPLGLASANIKVAAAAHDNVGRYTCFVNSLGGEVEEHAFVTISNGYSNRDNSYGSNGFI